MTLRIIAHAREVVEISAFDAAFGTAQLEVCFAEAERRYAESKTDPSRRLAARWAAKLAAAHALGGDVRPEDLEVVRGSGAPALRLTPRAAERMADIGANRAHVSLTHGLTHAAASVVLEAAVE